jgi:putative CocE/NonD family hydrolase
MNGTGALLSTPIEADEPDRYVYNPKDPVQSLGGQSCCFSFISPMGTADQRAVETRNDVLVYTAHLLDEAVTIAGRVTLTLFAATSGEDADFTAKLVDVHPDGPVINICDGIVRARYRNGTHQAEFVTPNDIVKYQIDLGNTAHTFLAGHRIRLEISSSNFPAYDRNPSSKVEPSEAEWKDFTMATQTIFHDAFRPSCLHLPVLSEG